MTWSKSCGSECSTEQRVSERSILSLSIISWVGLRPAGPLQGLASGALGGMGDPGCSSATTNPHAKTNWSILESRICLTASRIRDAAKVNLWMFAPFSLQNINFGGNQEQVENRGFGPSVRVGGPIGCSDYPYTGTGVPRS